jgi:hypothetical protein
MKRWIHSPLDCPVQGGIPDGVDGGVYGCLHQQPFHHQLLVCRHIAIAQPVAIYKSPL